MYEVDTFCDDLGLVTELNSVYFSGLNNKQTEEAI